jgi:DNA-binding transcriptional regulator YiaG
MDIAHGRGIKHMAKLSKEEKLRRKKERKAFDLQYQELYDKVKSKYNFQCAECDSQKITMHHIDFDHYNMVEENLIPLCWPCHIKRHHGYIGGKKLTKKEILSKVTPPSYVKVGTLEGKLKLLRLSKGEFAKRIDVNPSTVSHWLRSNNVPKLVNLYLDLLLDIQDQVDKLKNRYT